MDDDGIDWRTTENHIELFLSHFMDSGTYEQKQNKNNISSHIFPKPL